MFFIDMSCVSNVICVCSRISGVMFSVLDSGAVDRGFEQRSGQTKNFKIGICCLFAKHTALSRKNKDGLNQNNVSKWSDMSITDCCFSEL